MPWEIYAAMTPAGAGRLEELPDWFEPRPIGQADEMIELIRGVAPGVETDDPSWLRMIDEDYEIEIALGKGAQVHDLTFYIRRGGGAVVPIILGVCGALGVTPYETESGDRLTSSFQPPSEPGPDDEAVAKRRWWQRS
jgi:hypothetical protein